MLKLFKLSKSLNMCTVFSAAALFTLLTMQPTFACGYHSYSKKSTATTTTTAATTSNLPRSVAADTNNERQQHQHYHVDQMQKLDNASPGSNYAYQPAIFDAINQKMHQGMNVKYSNQVDEDFLRGMIPHHQGAVEMAQVVLKYSSDEKLKNLAQNIIKAQNQEIEMMQAWLTEKAKKTEKAAQK